MAYKEKPIEKKYLKLSDLAKHFGMSKATIFRWCSENGIATKRGKLPVKSLPALTAVYYRRKNN